MKQNEFEVDDKTSIGVILRPNGDSYIITTSTLKNEKEADDKILFMSVYDVNNNIILDNKMLSPAPKSGMLCYTHKNLWLKTTSDTVDSVEEEEVINYFVISAQNSDDPPTQKMSLTQLNLVSKKETLLSEHDFHSYEAKLMSEEDLTGKMENVLAVIFAENKTKKTQQIDQRYVALMFKPAEKWGGYMSFRNISGLQEDLFTIKTDTYGCKTIS